MKPIILLVEDNLKLSLCVKEYFEDSGYRVVCVSKGSDALDVLKNKNPSLMILDIDLPGSTNGMTILRSVRRHPKLKNLPIIMATALGTPAIVNTAKQVGIDDFVVKPYDLEDLVSRVEILLAKHTGLRVVS